MSEVRVRPAEVGDEEAIAGLHRYLHEPHVEAMPQEYPPFDREAAAGYYRGVLEAGQPVWVAEAGGVCVGFLGAEVRERPDSSFTRRLRVLYVHQVAVDPQVRRGGVGQALMEAVERSAVDLGCTEVRLEHRAFNEGAHRFYESLGYRTHLVGMAKPVAD